MRRRLSRQFWFVAVSALFALSLTAAAQPHRSSWYFISGTPTDADQTYPSALYSVDNQRKKLHVERQLVAKTDGVNSIHWSGDTVFVNYPNLMPGNVGVVHTNDPFKTDTVQFDSNGSVIIASALAMAESRPHILSELMWLTAPEDRHGGTMISVASAGEPRVKKDVWNEYSLLRFDGVPGGPVFAPDLIGAFDGGFVGIRFGNRFYAVDQLSPNIKQAVLDEVPYYLGVNENYLVFALQNHANDVESGALSKKTSKVAYVHDRRNLNWTLLNVEGSCSRTRILGPWLATIVQYWSPGHKPNPGIDNERSTRTDLRPSVRDLYAISASRSCSIPGVLILQSLSTGQKATIKTEQEDSEIVGIHGSTVLYRVNNKIYSATVEGESLKNSDVIVEDDDVPEIHWAFWSD